MGGYYRKNQIFIFLIFLKAGGDLLLVEDRKNLRLKTESLGVFWEVCRTVWRNSHSKCPKCTCKFRAFEYVLRKWGCSQSRVLASFMSIHAIKWPLLASSILIYNSYAPERHMEGSYPPKPHFWFWNFHYVRGDLFLVVPIMKFERDAEGFGYLLAIFRFIHAIKWPFL